jgi:hypothetical protein
MSKKLWFKAKTYGWGWTPITWQGWALVVGYLVLLTLLAFVLLPHTSGSVIDTVHLIAFVLLVLSATFILVGISFQKGEPPRWQWGAKKDGKDKPQ